MSPLETAIETALHGNGERKNLKVMGHTFTVKPAKVVQSEPSADGQISHHLTFRKDDQVFYHIEKKGGVVSKMNIEIVRGGITSLLAPLAPVAGLIGVNVTSDQVKTVGQQLGKLAEKDWVPAAQAIVLGIAAQL